MKLKEVFDRLKEKLVSPPVLEYAQFDKGFILVADASGEALVLEARGVRESKPGEEELLDFRTKTVGIDVDDEKLPLQLFKKDL